MEQIIKTILSKHSYKSVLIVLTHYLIVGVLLFSGISKVIDPENFLKVLNVTLGFLGENTIVLIATALPLFEFTLGTMLILKIKVKETLNAAVILFAAFLIFAIYGTIKGFDVDCGCFGSSISSEFGVGIVVRNIVLLILSILVYNLKDEIGFVKAQN